MKSKTFACLIVFLFLAAGMGLSIIQPEAIAQTSSTKPIVFGGALPLTGWGSDAGTYNHRGYIIWERIANKKGGILGRPVKIKVYDDQSDPTTTARLYEKLITSDKVDVLIAPWSDDMTMPATTVAERYKKPIVTGGATLDTIWARGYKYVCGLLPSSYDYVGVSVRLLKGKVKTAAVINNELTYTTGFGDAAVTNLKELGIKQATRQVYSADATDFTAALTKIRALKPDFLIGGTGVEDAIQIIRQSKEVGLNAKAFYFTIAPGEHEFTRLLGKDAEYVLGTTEWEPTFTHLPGFKDFYDAYMKEYGEEPVEDVATAYGIAEVLKKAIEKAGKIDDELINNALHTLDTTTVFGKYKVDPATGRQTGKKLFVIQIQDGKRNVIWPEDEATSKLRFPAPAWNKR
jgi:branched-chain amino acid transport system substrate-binding protein